MARKKGSKNKSTLAKEQMAAVNAQDQEYVNRENAKVLGVVNGTNDSSSSESYVGEDQDSDFEPGVDLESKSSTQASSTQSSSVSKRQGTRHHSHCPSNQSGTSQQHK
jgi:hypothetical protein